MEEREREREVFADRLCVAFHKSNVIKIKLGFLADYEKNSNCGILNAVHRLGQ